MQDLKQLSLQNN